MLKYLFGRPGSGKTTYIINEIKKHVDKGEKTYLLVPEQQAYISESMLADLPASSALCFEVVTFSRLCQIVFSRVGGLTDSHLGSAERQLIMWQSLREISGELQHYNVGKHGSSFGSLMLSMIDELHANTISAEKCEEAAKKCGEGALADKLYDISKIYATFTENVRLRCGENVLAAENKLSTLAKTLRENKLFANSNIFVDSFTSFTGEEYDILEQLIRQATNVTVAFTTMGASGGGKHKKGIEYTIKKFNRIADNLLITPEKIKLDNKLYTTPEIAAIEQCLWNFSVNDKTLPDISEKDKGSIECYNCLNEYEEANLVALQIIKAHKGGMKYSDIAVIMRDCESRRGIINAVFDKLHIPYFYSEKTDVSTTPAARLVLSALRCISFNFQSQDVLTLLKTGLCGIDPHDSDHSEADLFEDYCNTWKIAGSRFTDNEAWSMNPDGYTTTWYPRGKKALESANNVRRKLIEPLKRLKEKFALSGGDTVTNCRAIHEYLVEIGLEKNLADLAKLELRDNYFKDAGEILRTYDNIISVLVNISELLKDKPMNSEDLTDAIEIMLRHTDIGSVPMINDCVTIGSADTLRVENIKMAILLGLCEGEFPASYSDSGILSESDKARLEKIQFEDKKAFELSSREELIISDELFYVYRAMTKPSEKLILCTCSSKIGGSALIPSIAYNRIKFLFPYIDEYKFELSKFISKDISAAENNTRENEDEDDGVVIDPLIVRNILGNEIKLTKSSITSFVECPYKYWCESVLNLREQSVAEITSASAGTIIHHILENFLKDISEKDGTVPYLSDEDIVQKVNAITEAHIAELGVERTASLSRTFARVRNLALIMAKSTIEEFRSSGFKVFAYEKKINKSGNESLNPVVFEIDHLGEKVTVFFGGTVDRIDSFDDGNTRYLRIIDYKTGKHKFDPDKIENGEDIQLPAYLFTVAGEENKDSYGESKDIKAASGHFLSINEEGKITPIRSGFMLNEDNIINALGDSLKKDISLKQNQKIPNISPLDEDRFKLLEEKFKASVRWAGEHIYSGNVPKTPSEDACKYCKLRNTCSSAVKKD